MKTRAHACAIICAILAGCAGPATTANYEAILNQCVGMDEVRLIRIWGPPARAYEAGSHKFLTYERSQTFHFAGVAPTYTTQVAGDVAYTRAVGGTPGSDVTLSCSTTFELDNGTVTNWQHQGDCRARAPKK